ncbi:MAG: nitroreductase family protein [Pirellulales bacterium]
MESSLPIAVEVDKVIRARRTEKVLSAKPLPISTIDSVIDDLLEAARWAPFHRVCDEQYRTASSQGIEPWRVHILDAIACRRLAPELTQSNAGKIPAMLNSADALLIFNWLPSPSTTHPDQSAQNDSGEEPNFAPTLINMEHIAAASAAIQNLLIAATARGISNYWSSGGVLRSKEVYARLNIPRSEILLGALFLFPSEYGEAELAISKLRDQRTPSKHWSRRVELDL